MIHIQNLSFAYNKHQALLVDLSFDLENGSIVGLLGKNGAGKSTLLQLISGLLKPQLGQITINGLKPFDRLPNFLADIYMVPEEFAFPQITIGLYIKATAPLYPKFDYQKMTSILEEFELDTKNNLNKISHGQRKKFLIAFALSTNCGLLILDEPTNGLDIPSKKLFRKILVRSVSSEQLVFISTHQVKDIETIIDKIMVLNEGKMIFNQSVFDISKQWQFKNVASLLGVETPIYQEKYAGGYKIISPATAAEETEIDIELLFNALINHTNLTTNNNGSQSKI